MGPEHRKGEFFLFFSPFFDVSNEQDMLDWVHCIDQAEFANVLSKVMFHSKRALNFVLFLEVPRCRPEQGVTEDFELLNICVCVCVCVYKLYIRSRILNC